MPAKNPRIHVVLEKPLYLAVETLAHRESISLSMKVRDLVKEAMETYEDMGLAAFAAKRASTFDHKKALSHDQTWPHLKHPAGK
jgi:hypothetical protein